MKLSINNKEAQFIIRLADTELILGQRLAEMCSNGPTLEEDIAMSNLSLDLFGRSEELLNIVSKLEGGSHSADDYAYRRNEREYYSLKLVEQPNNDFAWIMVKQLMHDIYMKEVFTQLLNHSNTDLKAISEKVLKEVNYSLEHSKDWILRLGIGTKESNVRTQTAFNMLWKYMQEIFAFDQLDNDNLSDTTEIEKTWMNAITAILKEANLTIPETINYHYLDYRNGFHSEYLGDILATMQFLPRAYPDAKW